MKKQKLKSWKRRQVMRGNSYCNARLQKPKTSQTSPSPSKATSLSTPWAISSSTLFNFYSNAKSPKSSLRHLALHVKCDKVQVVLGRKYNLYFWQFIYVLQWWQTVSSSDMLRSVLNAAIWEIWSSKLLNNVRDSSPLPPPPQRSSSSHQPVSEVASLSSWPGKGARARQRHLESHHCALYSDPHPFFTIAGIIIIIITITITLISIPPIGGTPLLFNSDPHLL